MIGKALYDGVLIDVAFAPFFTNKILGQYSYLEDLPNLDPTLYKSLIDLKRYEGDAKDLCLDFTVCDEFFGQVCFVTCLSKLSLSSEFCSNVGPSCLLSRRPSYVPVEPDDEFHNAWL